MEAIRGSRVNQWLGRRRIWIGGVLGLVLILTVGALLVGVTAAPEALGCTSDLQGANDEPGQKDLTRMCVDYEYAAGQQQVIWQWDEIAWSGSNTGDACSLYDVDPVGDAGYGKADYALCVTVAGKPAEQVTGADAYSPRLYSCNDSDAYKCAGGTLLKDNQTLISTCAVSQENWDPFTAGADYPEDTVADCKVLISEVGGNGTARLLDVCSFPSQQPNSDPSDCIIYAPKKGDVRVKKVVPSGSGTFDLLVDGEVKAPCVGDGGDTGAVSASAGIHTLSEQACTGTNLSDYTTTYSCTNGQSGSGTSVDVTVVAEQTVECTFTNTRNTGSLKISKTVSNPDGATLPASFTVNYNCGTGYTGSVSVAPGSPATVPNIPTGSVCTVTEVAPAPIAGYTWGTITYTPGSVEITAKGGTYEIVVGNSITRDRGSLKVSKTVSNPDGATLPASFTVNYNCGTGYTGSVSVAPGSPATVPGIPTGSVCTVTEVAPALIAGYRWGTITYTPSSVEITTKGETYEIAVGNSITRDRGSLKILKTLTGGPAGYSDSFGVHVVCTGDGGTYDPTIVYPTPGYLTIENIPTGNECTVTEPTLPTAPDSYLWDSPDITGSPAMITKDTTAMVTVANTLLEVSISLDKQIRAGEDGEWVDNLMEAIVGTPLYYRFIVTNDGDVPLTGVTVDDPTLGVPTCNVGDLDVGESHTCGPYGPYPAAYNDSEVVCNVATASGYADGILATDMDEACYAAFYWAFTPGFWKNHYYDPDKPQQNDAWQFTTYHTIDLVADVFVWPNCAYSLSEYGLPGELNLLDALSLRGGGGEKGAAQILLRTGVASLLNASFHEKAGHDIGPGGVFPYTSEEIIEMVTCALANGDRQEKLDLADHLDMINNGVDYIVWP